jgi:hypothetical protein
MTTKFSPGSREAVSMKAEYILTPNQLAERLQVKPSWVYEKCRRCAKYSGEY